jgi:hypothetical protein
MESASICSFRFPAGAPVVLDEHNVDYKLLARISKGERSLAEQSYSWDLAGQRLDAFYQQLTTGTAGTPPVPTDREPAGV